MRPNSLRTDWVHANRDHLVAELGVLRAQLRVAAGVSREDAGCVEADVACAEAREQLAGPSALDEVAEGFRLSAFERATLLLVAGPELVAGTADELIAVSGSPRLSFGVALSLLADEHWSALSPAAPLRRWGLVRLVDPTSPARSPLIIDERVLHHLAGAGHLDPALASLSQGLSPPSGLPLSLQLSADGLAGAWAEHRPVVLHGPQVGNLRVVAAAGAASLGLFLLELRALDLPGDAAQLDTTLRLMEREAVLTDCAWAIDLRDARTEDAGALTRGLSTIEAPVVLLSDDERTIQLAASETIAVARLRVGERREVLAAALNRHGAPSTGVDLVAGVFDLAVEDIDAAAADTARGVSLWQASRDRARPAFGSLAAVLEPRASWDRLVLPEPQREQLRALVSSVRHRTTVLDDWGFGDHSVQGLGTTALFIGPSGSGKTLAAEVIAHELELDLVRVDLSQVVSKYIGETEKNLRQVFDAADDAAAVLLFDEADTLFAKRTEVRDSHDRYANLEVGYLLQRMEAFRGLAVLTTNARSTMDQAFLRRLRTIVTFPYPDVAAREAMWRGAFPASTPRRDLDPAALAVVDVPGGGIASIAIGAAYLGAADGGEVTSEHVHTATRWELAKSGRTSTSPGSRGRSS